MMKATFAAGSFWGVEASYRDVPGVVETRVGYIGGTGENPTYEEVRTGATGHAEAVEIVFDPETITYERLLEIFWEIHDPTTLDRQGPDVGSQYRSAIFFHTPEQERAARSSKDRHDRAGQFDGPIVTQIAAAGRFYPAEERHQRYLEKRGMAGSPESLRRR